MKTTRRILYWIGVACGGILLVVQLGNGATSLLRAGLPRLATPVVAAVVMGMVSIAVQIESWRRLMRVLGVRLTRRLAYSGYSMSFVARYVPGTIWGYLGRAEWLRHELGVQGAVTHLGSLAETAIILTANLVLLGGLGWLTLPSEIAGPLSFGVGVLVSLAWPLGLWVVRRRKSFGRLEAAQAATPMWAGLALCLGLSMLLWLVSAAAMAAVMLPFRPTPQAALTALPAMAFVYCLAWLVGFVVPIVPSGLGIRETTLTLLLHLYVGIPIGDASAVALLGRLALVLAELLMLGLGLFLRSTSKE